MSALAERAEEAFGPIHVVCHNAGVFAAGLSWEAPLADYAWVFDVNVWGVIHGVRASRRASSRTATRATS